MRAGKREKEEKIWKEMEGTDGKTWDGAVDRPECSSAKP